MQNKTIRKLIYTALCVTIGLVLPQLAFHLPVANVGAVLLPMHIPVLICGLLCGFPYGALCGAVLPLLSYAFTGMPPLFPVAVSMMFELFAYGVISAVVYKVTKGNIFISLIAAMLGGRVVMGIANVILLGLAGKTYGMTAFIAGAFVTALPGILIQLVIIPAIIFALKKAHLSPMENR